MNGNITRDLLVSGLTHEDFFVRSVCLYILADDKDPGLDVTRAVCSAIDAHGWEDAFEYSHQITALGLDGVAVDWMVERLLLNGPAEDGREHIRIEHCLEWLAGGPVALFERWLEPLGIDPADDRYSFGSTIRLRTELSQIAGPQCLERLDEVLEECVDALEFPSDSVAEMRHLCERLAALDSPGDSVLQEWMEQEFRPEEEPATTADYRVGAALYIMQHRRRLGVPVDLITRVLDIDWDWLNEVVEATFSIAASAEDLKTILESYPQMEWHVRLFLSAALEKNRDSELEEKLIDVAEAEPDLELKLHLGRVLAVYGTPESMRAAKSIFEEITVCGDSVEIVRVLYAFDTLLGRDSEELRFWRNKFESERERLTTRREELGSFYQDIETGHSGGSQTVTRDGPKIGRNDPCPCGSGKKFKKCCLSTAN